MTLAVAEKRHPSRNRRALLRFITALIALAMTFGGSAPAFAHAEFLDASPNDGAVLETAPERASLRFNEPVQVVEGSFRLFPGDGAPVVLDARTVNTTVEITLPKNLSDDAYALSYRVVSADGHPVAGALTFQIGNGQHTAPDATQEPNEPVVTDAIASIFTAAQYLGLLALAGLLFFSHFIARDVRVTLPRIRRLTWIGYGVALGATLLLIPVSGSRVTGNEFITFRPDAGDLVVLPFNSWAAGVSWQTLASAALVLVFGLVALIFDTRDRRAGRVSAFVMVCAGLALSVPVLVGHSQTVQPVWVMIGADLGHLATGAFWFGGVLGLICTLMIPRQKQAEGKPVMGSRQMIPVLGLFSYYALVSVIVLAISGTVMGLLIVGSWSALFNSDYGRLLQLKLGMVLCVIALAAVNRFGILPKISQIPTAALQWVVLRRTLNGEAMILILVLAFTGFLANTSPNDSENQQVTSAVSEEPARTHLHAESQGLTVHGFLTPGEAGENTVTFRLQYEGANVTPGEVRIEVRLPDEELGPFTSTPAIDPNTGDYTATLTLPVSGEWNIQVSARIDTFAQPIVVIPVAIA